MSRLAPDRQLLGYRRIFGSTATFDKGSIENDGAFTPQMFVHLSSTHPSPLSSPGPTSGGPYAVEDRRYSSTMNRREYSIRSEDDEQLRATAFSLLATLGSTTERQDKYYENNFSSDNDHLAKSSQTDRHRSISLVTQPKYCSLLPHHIPSSQSRVS